MTIGTSNRTAIRYIAEVTPGTTPATPALKELRFTGESLGKNITNVKSNEIRSDRNISGLIPTDVEIGGDINGEMSYGTYDDFIEAALATTWATNVAKNGTTRKFFTVQKNFTDALSGAGIFNNFRGAMIDSWDFEVVQGQIINTKFGIKALTMDNVTTQIAGATTPAATTTQVMSAVSNIAAIKEDTVTTTEFYRKLSVSVKNNVRSLKSVGVLGAIDMNMGTCDVTGSLEMYFGNITMLNRYLGATGFALSFEMVDGATKYTVNLPKVKFETGVVVAGGLDQDIMYTGNIRALYDSGVGASIQVTRVP
jgi:hypothetical protein